MKFFTLTIALLVSTFLPVVLGNGQPDLVVMGYNSYDAPLETLIFGSIAENEGRATDGTDRNIQSIGLGSHLWTIDEEGPELKRGWMFRLRLTMQSVKDEFERRNKEDFVVMIADSVDVFVKESLDYDTLNHLRHRFLTDFSDHKIVFSTQIYCCNPWELREFGRRDWDAFYNKKGDIPSMYKHLNAGTFMGYASALIEMADEMQLWNTTYHRHEGFHSLAGLESTKSIHMIDLEVDDDEWQLSAWFFQDQEKKFPLATLDYHQDLFAVTGTFRAQESSEDDDGYEVFPRNHFYNMFGPFPENFDKDNDMEQLVVCPYEYDATTMEFTNTITGGHPLVFHFAGNDWLCACTVFALEGFKNVPNKFRDNCINRYSLWFDRVQDSILEIAESEDGNVGIHLRSLPEELVSADDSQVGIERQLRSVNRNLDGSPYKKKRIPRELDSNPYKKKRIPRELYVPRELDGNPYKKKRIPRELDSNPYKKKRVPRELDSNPYKKKRIPRELYVPRELDSNPYKKKRIPRELDSNPYKKKRIPRELDSNPYKKKRFPRELYVPRELDSNPYK